MSRRRIARWAGLAVLAVVATATAMAHGAPAVPYRLQLQGVVRDANGQIVVSGDVAVRFYADSLGGSPLYDSGSLFLGRIVQSVFDLEVGRGLPITLDPERSYFLELDLQGVEMLGDAAGGRWRFYPGGGSRARTDLEQRLTAMEQALGLSPAPLRPARAERASVARTASTYSDRHGLLGLGVASGVAGGYSATANLLTLPIGPLARGGVEAWLGPYYFFAPLPNPQIVLMKDVPGDQGGSIRVRWRRDLRERAWAPNDTLPRITSYTLYRRVAPGQSLATRVAPSPEEAAALPPGDWDVLASVPATLDTAYQTVVPTLCDSSGTGNCWSTFLVRSITDRVGIFYNSLVDSGYSKDNLSPNVPAGLTAQSVTGGEQLSWQASDAPDFQYFRVYRGTDPGFAPGPASLMQATTGTQWIDSQRGSYTYKVTATDFHGNESPPAAISVTVGVEMALPSALAFASLAPNPFRHSLSMVVEVPDRAGAVDLAVFDLAGRRLRTIVSGPLAPGRHPFLWDGQSQDGRRVSPGVFVLRLTGAGRTITRRATLLP